MAEASINPNRMSIDGGAKPGEGVSDTTTEPEQGKGNMKSLAEMAQKKLLDDLASSLDFHARSGTFACGGSFPIATSAEAEQAKSSTNATNEAQQSIPPVQIRFGKSGKGFTLVLPTTDPSSKELVELLSACQPASFGRGGDEVLDEDYRKAGKLDREAFATTFCPYEAGIIDVVSQLLVPQTKHERDMCSIKAELYKLNVYSSPSGKFKAHVDTPRSELQIGSLVVVLPMNHTGGSLAVRHLGKEILFDWSMGSGSDTNENAGVEDADANADAAVKWAAFYSDCEHEVHEVISGHRLTLTYNLYLCRGQGHLAGSAPQLDATHLPLHKSLGGALANPSFLTDGDVLGIWLTHSYAHTSEAHNFLPSSLQGADMSLYETARALGLECVLVPIMFIDGDYMGHYDEYKHIFQSKFFPIDICEYGGTDGVDIYEETKYWGTTLTERKIMWLNEAVEDRAEAQMAYMTYGNQPSLNFQYSSAAMVIRIPKFNDRGISTKPEQSILEVIEADPDERSIDGHEESDYDVDGED